MKVFIPAQRGQLQVIPPCGHDQAWKRCVCGSSGSTRFKRGYSVFVCTKCKIRWKQRGVLKAFLPASDSEDSSSTPPSVPEPEDALPKPRFTRPASLSISELQTGLPPLPDSPPPSPPSPPGDVPSFVGGPRVLPATVVPLQPTLVPAAYNSCAVPSMLDLLVEELAQSAFDSAM
eukprot:NODE_2320_length_1088_cov_95.944849_g2302_i0.p2 GENE.NODE_2320_length_1088_cov_95.944849_g2302_i0~~NODE_2320_length_1088_cov_95.944849_g2302_i0.p2  ORF type:complete len:175 (+),score=17.09 NODE_2320_length_1088_cov_95.944849_g2302_i0:69-593(+)